jgi:hypothetical protein
MIQPAAPNAAPSPTVTPALPKVLRIGLVVESKIKQERLVRVGESVTIGKGNATFQVDGTNLSSPLEVFSYRKADKCYVLTVPEWVDGRMHWKGGIKTLAEVRADNGATQKGDLWTYVLNDSVRGKLNVGSATLLFQFVPAPPEPVHVVAESLRPHLFDREDPLFMSLLGAFGAVGVAFMVVISTYQVPPQKADPGDIFEVMGPPKPIPPKVVRQEPKVAEAGPSEEKAPEAAPKEEAPKEAAPAPAAAKQEASKPQTRGEALANTALGRRLKAIGTAGFGKAGAGTTAPSFGIVASDGGGGAGGTGPFMPSTGGGGGGTGVTFAGGKVGEGTIGGGGAVAAGSGGPVEVKKMAAPVTVDQPPAAAAPGDSDCIKKARSYSRRIETCVSTMLAANPTAAGAITVRWEVVEGAAVGVDVVTNQTGDAAFAACVTKQVNSWKFGDLTCAVPGYTWRVSAQ